MGLNVNPQQALAMFSIVFAASEEERRPKQSAWLKSAEQRRALERARFIELEKDGRSKRVVLTDAGWEWAAANLNASLPQRNRAARVLGEVLKRLSTHLSARGEALAHFAGMPAANDQRGGPPGAATSDSPSLPERIRSAALELGGGQARTRVRLGQLRARLGDVPREQLDRELLALQRTGSLVLYRIDDPTDVTKDDERAALQVAGYPRHILYLEQ